MAKKTRKFRNTGMGLGLGLVGGLSNKKFKTTTRKKRLVKGTRREKRVHNLDSPDADLDVIEAGARKLVRRVNTKLIKIQPHGKKKYSGMGLARGSKFIDLCEPNLMETWQDIWSEHIEGFGMGLAFKKSLKKQRESEMIWRVRYGRNI